MGQLLLFFSIWFGLALLSPSYAPALIEDLKEAFRQFAHKYDSEYYCHGHLKSHETGIQCGMELIGSQII